MFKITKTSTIVFLVLSIAFTAMMAFGTLNALSNGRYGWALFSALLAVWNGFTAVENYKRLQTFK